MNMILLGLKRILSVGKQANPFLVYQGHIKPENDKCRFDKKLSSGQEYFVHFKNTY